MDGDTSGSEFAGERVGPLLQEGLGAGVGREQGRGCQSAEGAHCEDEALFLGKHVREDYLRGA